MARAFVIRPFDKKKDSAGKEIDFNRIHDELISPALKAAGFRGDTTGEIVDAGNIREDMFSLILEADLVICDVTIHNANVFYELGLRHALRKRRTILIKGNLAADNIPFDLLTDRYLIYELENPATSLPKLIEAIKATHLSDRETDSPVFKMLPLLPEADLDTIQAVPFDFREEVERASAGKSKGWLRLLAQEIRGLRFQWAGLRLVAQAQWNLRDFVGARESLEKVREFYRDDVDANLALANIYERLYREQKKPQLLVLSDQAIERVLTSSEAIQHQRVEALALRGRNHKTRWRRDFGSLSTVAERRQAASSQLLRESYEAYRSAFYQDLNHFYSGLAALQMGTIFLDLSGGEDDSWKATFDDDAQAEAYRRGIGNEIEALRVLVPASIEAKQGQLKPNDSEHLWAKISKADLLFLTEQNEPRISKRYRDAIPPNQSFAWDSARGQLQLFAELGVKANLANKVITTLDGAFAEPPKPADRPAHIILFAGHRIDEPGRLPARFPAERAEQARELLSAALQPLRADYDLQGFASAAPGADLLFHEVCAELDIPSLLCLPMPQDAYASSVFGDLDAWRSRFLDLIEKKNQVLELSDREGLPKWLASSGINAWERGNHWVLQMALAAEAPEITLLALWDGKDKGDAPGGTGQMVNLARKAGKIRIRIIDTQKLLE